ncbi:MAG: MarR family transcriptional regulator [Pseudomonadota bacterium]
MQEKDLDPADLALMSEGCIALNLRRAARIATRRYEDALRPLGLTSFQFSALKALSEHDAIPHGELAKAFALDLSTLSRNVRPLIARGLAGSETDAKDKRVKRLTATAEGRALYAAALPLWAGAQRETLDELGPRVWPMLRASLRCIEE